MMFFFSWTFWEAYSLATNASLNAIDSFHALKLSRKMDIINVRSIKSSEYHQHSVHYVTKIQSAADTSVRSIT